MATSPDEMAVSSWSISSCDRTSVIARSLLHDRELPEQGPVIDQHRLGHEPRRQRMAEQRPLPQQRAMIAKRGERRQPSRELPERSREVGVAPRRGSGGHARQVAGPREQPVDQAGKARAALVTRAGVDARSERDDG